MTWLTCRRREWVPPPGALPPMRMTASWLGPEVDLPNTSLPRQKMRPMASSPRILNRQAPSDANLMQKAPVAVHHRSACSGVKALRNTSAAKRQAAKPWLAFRSLDPFRALREPDRRRRDEERPFRSEQRTATNQNDYLTGKAPYKSCKPSVPERGAHVPYFSWRMRCSSTTTRRRIFI